MAVWSKDRLKERTNRRLTARANLQPAEQAALAWARWQGMTDEAGLDRRSIKAELDRMVDEMAPEQWQQLYTQLGTTEDAAMRGVLRYSLERAQVQAAAQAQALTQSPTPAPRSLSLGQTPPPLPQLELPQDDGSTPSPRRKMKM